MPASIYSLHYDILLAIFRELSLYSISGPDLLPHKSVNKVNLRERVIRRRSLARAALVCSAFADPATEVLWSAYFSGKMRILLSLLSGCKKGTDESHRKVYVSHHSDLHGRPTTLTESGPRSISTVTLLQKTGLPS